MGDKKRFSYLKFHKRRIELFKKNASQLFLYTRHSKIEKTTPTIFSVLRNPWIFNKLGFQQTKAIQKVHISKYYISKEHSNPVV